METAGAVVEPFSFREAKDGSVRISYRGRVVTTLAGKEASRFLSRIDLSNARGMQLIMAKATGHFKHGNERAAKLKGRGQ